MNTTDTLATLKSHSPKLLAAFGAVGLGYCLYKLVPRRGKRRWGF